MLPAAYAVPVAAILALSGAVGYDDVETTAPAGFISANQLTGTYWRAGFRARLGRKTDVRLEYGERYGADFITANAKYDVPNRVTFSAGTGRSFQTRAQSASTQFEALQSARAIASSAA